MPTICALDAAFGGIAWVVFDGRSILARGWKSFPSETRTLRGLAEWLDASLLPHARIIDRVFIESTNVFPEAADAETGQARSFMLQYQVSVRECVQAVAMYCVMMGVGQGEPTMVYPATWRSSFKNLIGKPRPKGAAAWKAWSKRTAELLYPGCLAGLKLKASEDVADACLLAGHAWGTLQPSAKLLKPPRKKATKAPK